jgi:hypothetical protein
MSKLTRFLYKAARNANDIETIASCNPKRIMRRVKNKIMAKLFWKLFK